VGLRVSVALFLAPLALQGATVDGVVYTNLTRPGPIEIHFVRIPRRDASLEFRSIHSGGKAIGRSPVSEQIKRLASGTPIAAINGDFFQLEGAFAGDPRGLQIVNGVLVSAPSGNGSFWIDSAGAPHIASTRSGLRITWPNGSSMPLVLNAPCGTNEMALYSPDMDSPRTENVAREFILVPKGGATNATLRAGSAYSMEVLNIREPSNVPIAPGAFALDLGTTAVKSAPEVRVGAVVKISTATTPRLYDAVTAVGGGPILVIGGKRQRFDKAESDAFRHRFMVEKHPRTALGWSEQEFFWVEVDGRHQNSVGMTLNELGELMIELGCVEAMNLDGGGSSTLWFDGKVRNRPSDGAERPVANSLAVVRKPAPAR